ncbi:S1C family serine protease [Paenibacillus turpanensis]|uniref:S1C family serine protease n=1 Tax=Paenibacillus turpanensis TaxID=2689078 RepID=UPI001409545E|nr:trypsin-like peptidase domain-containing protein [Paenibacillus turpanensis]
MEDHRNRNRDYSDFFKERTEESEQGRQDQTSTERPVYYTYDTASGSSYSREERQRVELSPEEVQPEVPRYPVAAGGGDSFGGGPVVPVKPQSRKSGFRSMFSAFLAGALVVGSLMFVSDRYDLFTAPGAHAQASESASAQVTANGETLAAASEVVRPNNIAAIARQTSPAIVKIETYTTSRGAIQQNPFFQDPFFRQFFGDSFSSSQQSKPSKKQQSGMGTGFIFEKSGYILTNQHVIDGAEEILVQVQGYQEPLKAKLLGSAYELDLAVLKIESDKDFPTLSFGSSDAINVGDWVVAIGNPYGFDHTVTVGVLSAKERPIDISDSSGTRHYKHLLQTDASINPGNSGGPLLNLAGEVVGINTAVNAEAQGIGFAIPSSTVLEVLDYLKEGKEVPKQPEPYIGIGLSDIDQTWVNELKVESTEGALITQVQRGTPADKAGLEIYDVILEAGGKKVKSTAELIEVIKAAKIGERMTMTISRDGQKIEVGVIIGDKNAQQN